MGMTTTKDFKQYSPSRKREASKGDSGEYCKISATSSPENLGNRAMIKTMIGINGIYFKNLFMFTAYPSYLNPGGTDLADARDAGIKFSQVLPDALKAKLNAQNR